MNRPDAFDKAWADLRRRIRIFWGLVLGFFPALLLLGAATSSLNANLAEVVMIFIGGIWWLGLIAAGAHRQLFKCPRCGELFFARRFWANQFARKCLHCKLPRWAKSDGMEQ